VPATTLRQQFLRHNAQTSSFPLLLEFVKAEGCFLYAADGSRCMDLISGIGVSNLGHGNPEIRDAAKAQIDAYMHQMVYGEFVVAPQVEFAAKLAGVLPPSLNSIYFVNSGTEAAEGAMKLARRYTGRSEILGFVDSYHGSTLGALSIMGNETYKTAFRPLLPSVGFLRLNIDSELDKISTDTAAIFLETIQGESGVQVPSGSFMRRLRQRCSETGTLLVLDEIQCGLGRTGSLFAFDHYRIVPDILLLAKSLGGGMPLGAFISSAGIMNSLTASPVLGHITSFGGHPVSCAAGLAALTVLLREEIIQKVEEKSRLFASLLNHPAILEVRRKGLLIGVQFSDFDFNKRVIDACINKGVLVDWFLHESSAMRICPPLIISQEEIHWACQVILEVLA